MPELVLYRIISWMIMSSISMIWINGTIVAVSIFLEIQKIKLSIKLE